MTAFILMSIIFISICRQGWSKYWVQYKTEAIWKPSKEGQEEDCESRQLSLGGAIEATK